MKLCRLIEEQKRSITSGNLPCVGEGQLSNLFCTLHLAVSRCHHKYASVHREIHRTRDVEHLTNYKCASVHYKVYRTHLAEHHTHLAEHHTNQLIFYHQGYAPVPLTAPGLGIELVEEEVKKHLDPRDKSYFAPTKEWDEKRSHDRTWS